jgi:single-strand DNA-binding protein
MRHINSILLECVLTEDPIVTDSEKLALQSCYFSTETRGIDNKTGMKLLEKSQFTVEAWGKLAQTCKERLKTGSSIRVVGRIKTKQGDDNCDLPEFFIVAEHIEIKPESKESNL